MNAADLIKAAKVGDKVKILVPNSISRNGVEYAEKWGKVMIKSPGYLALNMGGKFGKPGVANEANIVALKAA